MEKKMKGAATSSLSWWSCMAVACMVGMLVMAKHAKGVSCGDAVNALIPCGAYLIGDGAKDPSAQCCASAQGLKKMAKTVEARRELCQCFKDTGPSFGVNPKRAKNLPSFCKLNLTIAINSNVNCSMIG
ncbi:Plant non-specific lipid-transfer protein/Par allergen protein [Dioscorea alata]|uniref:Plant non-specific lipid-transfer protein/Par allergen protein n=1 Tax=Dioscorea alata TaxID=55571 RepID=A0ACB7VEW8_DIOAL|nr:Plant non-specific lipid-transfer protein/Par allergen protein [Dioscorea alata]